MFSSLVEIVRYAVLQYIDSEETRHVKLIDANSLYVTVVDFTKTEKLKI